MRLLVVLSRFPYPLEKGDKLRAYHQIRLLSQKYDVYLFVISDRNPKDEESDELHRYCKAIKVERINIFTKLWNTLIFVLKGMPAQCGYFFRSKAKKSLQQFANEVNADKVYCQFVRTVPLVKDLQLSKTIDYQDALSMGMKRRYEQAKGLKRLSFRQEYLRLQQYEQEVYNCFDHHTIITSKDRDVMPVKLRRNLLVVGNGVDFEKFAYHGEVKNYDLIFAGNMGYAPNVDAAEYLVRSVMPRLLRRLPGVRLVLCGANPSARVRALQSESVEVTGWVDSMAEYYARSRVFIAPMRMGTGLQNKLLEAMATEIPCVVSMLAAAPLVSDNGQKPLMVCSSEDEYVHAILRLLEDREFYRQITTQAHRYVTVHYSWEAATKPLIDILSQD